MVAFCFVHAFSNVFFSAYENSKQSIAYVSVNMQIPLDDDSSLHFNKLVLPFAWIFVLISWIGKFAYTRCVECTRVHTPTHALT